MKAIAGASGVLGSRIARELLSQGDRVRVLVRSKDARTSWEALGAETVTGDLTDPASLDALCSGADVVITTASAIMRGDNAAVEKVDVEGNRNLIDAAARAGVRRFVFVSTALADPTSSVPLFRAKGLTEEYLRQSSLDWTILAPHVFMESWIEMMVGIPLRVQLPVWIHGNGRTLHSFVSMNDVAEVAAAVAQGDRASKRKMFLGGHPVSWREVVDQCQEFVEETIEMRFLPPRTAVPHVSEPFGTTLGVISEMLDARDVVIESSAVFDDFGVTPTPLRTFLITMLADRRKPFRGQPAIAPQGAADRAMPPVPEQQPMNLDPTEAAHDENPNNTPATDPHKPGAK